MRDDERRARDLVGESTTGGFDALDEALDEALDHADIAALADALDPLSDPDLWADPRPGLAAQIEAAVRADGGTRTAVPAVPTGDRGSRRRYWILPAIAAGAAAAILLGVTLVDSGPDGTSVALAATENAPGAGGQATITETGSGVRVELDAWGLPPSGDHEYYEAWLTGDDGWVPLGAVEEGKEVVLSAGVSLDGYKGLCVTRQARRASSSGEQDTGEQMLFGPVRERDDRSGGGSG